MLHTFDRETRHNKRACTQHADGRGDLHPEIARRAGKGPGEAKGGEKHYDTVRKHLEFLTPWTLSGVSCNTFASQTKDKLRLFLFDKLFLQVESAVKTAMLYTCFVRLIRQA